MKSIKDLVLICSFLIFLILFISPRIACGVEKIPPDERAIKLINELFNALSLDDEDSRLKAVIPLVHKSLLTADGNDLNSNVKSFSYKKACQNVKFYKNPAKIRYVLKGNVMTVGFGKTAERGRTDRYFVEKKEGVAGMPAPIHIFWPESGGEPRIMDMGSL